MTKEETAAKKAEKNKKKGNVKLSLGWGLIAGALILVIVFISVVGYLVYAKKNESAVVKGITKVIPYPAVIAEGNYVGMNSFYDQMDILKKYYQEFKKTDFNSDEGKSLLNESRKEVIERLTEDAIVEKEAKKLGVKVDKKELNESFDKLVVSNGGQTDFAEILKKYYGLSINDFKTKIYEPRFLREKMTEKINSEESTTGAAKKKADELTAKIKSGEDFAKLAKENSGDPGSAANGGDLGLFGKGKMVPEFEEAAFKLNVGQVSEPIRTVYGYHIIKVTEKKGEEIRASHILIKVRDFNEWLAEKKADLKKTKYLKIIPAIWEFYKV